MFGYTMRDELRIHNEASSADKSSKRERSPDFSAFARRAAQLEEGEHVLVLEFNDTTKVKKPTVSEFAYAMPPTLTPAAMKKLVEKRNERFSTAVNEYVILFELVSLSLIGCSL